ncbi:hypothetical protein FACS189490_10900 [Clostridia bacterium]|nr:hypothetical protein FACS189490_10900 [Clostridia bacterium]
MGVPQVGDRVVSITFPLYSFRAVSESAYAVANAAFLLEFTEPAPIRQATDITQVTPAGI